jgi:hypothetical protein
MTDITLDSYESNSRWRFDLVLPALFRPRSTFARIAQATAANWHTPIFILLATGLIFTLVGGAIEQALIAAGGPGVLPPGFEWYTPEQQAQYQQTMAATSGPVFVYLLPSVMSLLGVYLGWLILSWVLHLGLTLAGGRGSSQQALNIVAWSLLPFAIRDLVRIVALWTTGQPLTGLGLSGFVSAGDGAADFYVAALLTMVDLYLFWHIGLLLVGVRAGENLSRFKIWSAVLLTVIGLLLLRALPSLLAAQFNDLTIIRPFM